MSQFMPDGPYQTQPPAGVADITPTNPETTSADIALMQRVLFAAARNPNLIPADFMAYVLDWIQTQRLTIPIGQVFGFTQFTLRGPEYVGADETRTGSTAYGDLATVGPQLTGLADGLYAFWFGCAMKSPNSLDFARMSLKYNSTEAVDSDACETTAVGWVSVSRSTSARLSNGGSNTVTARYSIDNIGETGSFGGRWLMALRISN